MTDYLRVLMIDASTSFYRIDKFRIGERFGPVDLGLYLSGMYNSINIGVGLLSGSIFPGSNRLIINGFSPCWGGFYISSMGGAGLVFDNLGINLLSIIGKAPTPSIMYLNRVHGEEIEAAIVPIEIHRVWQEGRGGVYSLMDYALDRFGEKYLADPRILATGPAAEATDFGALVSVPVKKGKLTNVDTWAGRGGFGSKLYREHGLAGIIYGGTFIDEDFRDRKVADQWFIDKYNKKLAAKDLEATTKYRFEPDIDTGGTFGVNYATMGGSMIAFNYKSIYMTEEQRCDIHERFILGHYLKQFNEETIKPKQQYTCGEPCVAVCKKMNNEFKKDYEPYQTLGPLNGIFDQRAAEQLNHYCDMCGFDAISAGGIVSWLMECLSENLLSPADLGVKDRPVFTPDGFNVVSDSMHNSDLAMSLLRSIIEKRGILDLHRGARRFARYLALDRGPEIHDSFVYIAFARNGWMVPNQYWTPGVLSPMAIMGKYYMHYGQDFLPPRELGRFDAHRLKQELILDNMGLCRFHRKWAEEMIPEIMDSLYGLRKKYEENISVLAGSINSRNSSVFWESGRNIDFVYRFMKRKQELDGGKDSELDKWIGYFERDRNEAALSYWYEMHKGILESLREF